MNATDLSLNAPETQPHLSSPKSLTRNTMDLFTSLTIHGLARTSNGEHVPLVLDRAASFPARLLALSPLFPFESHPNQAARPLPQPAFHLELDVATDKLLGYGRIGDVIAANVRGAKPLSESVSSPPPLLPPLCIKLVPPTRCRSLAREAYFYEKLDDGGLQGVSVPRCYGFFEARISLDDLQILPWPESDIDDWFLDADDPVPDDEECEFYRDDEALSKTSSRWNNWKASRESPSVTVLVLEKMGRRMLIEEYTPTVRAAIKDMFQDIAGVSITHDDERFCNILRDELGTALPCPRHGLRHQWRIIDFDTSRYLTRFDRVSQAHAGTLVLEYSI